jgi:hypothetical protein
MANVQAELRALFEDWFAASPDSEDDVTTFLREQGLNLSLHLGLDLPPGSAQADQAAALLLAFVKWQGRLAK